MIDFAIAVAIAVAMDIIVIDDFQNKRESHFDAPLSRATPQSALDKSPVPYGIPPLLIS